MSVYAEYIDMEVIFMSGLAEHDPPRSITILDAENKALDL